jgi:hypothetical protein
MGTFKVVVVPPLNNTGVTISSSLSSPKDTICSGSTATITINNLICSTGYVKGLTNISVANPVLSSGVSGGVPASVTNNLTNATFNIGALSITGCASGTAVYTIKGKNGVCDTITLGTITIRVLPALSVAKVYSSNPSLCSGGSYTDSIVNNTCTNGFGALTKYTISVLRSGANILATGLPVITTNSTGIFTVNPTISCYGTFNTVTYQIKATNGSPCTDYSLDSFKVTVYPALNNTGVTVTSTLVTPKDTLCSGSSATININNLICSTGYVKDLTVISVANPVLSAGVSGGVPSGLTYNATDANFAIAGLSITGCASGTAVYTIKGKNGSCDTITLGTITIRIIPIISAGASIATATTTICSGSSFTDSVTTRSCSLGYGSLTAYTISVLGTPGTNIATQGLPGSTTNSLSLTFNIRMPYSPR